MYASLFVQKHDQLTKLFGYYW